MKFKRLTLVLLMFMTALIAVASPTYAYTTSGFTYVTNGNHIDVAYEANTGLDINYIGEFTIDVRDAVQYNPAFSYTLVIDDQYDSWDQYLPDVYALEVVVDGQDEWWVSCFGGSNPEFLITNNVHIYWEVEETDNTQPVLNGETAFVTTIDDPITIAEISSYISAVDETDGNVTNRVSYVDSAREFLIVMLLGFENDNSFTFTKTMDEYLSDYDNNTLNVTVDGLGTLDKAGVDGFWSMTQNAQYSSSITTLEPPAGSGQTNWALDYYVYDDAGNYAYLHVVVLVTDPFAPTVQDDSVTVSYATTFDLDSYRLNNLVYSDNYDSHGDLVTSIDTNNYTAYKGTPGSYEVVFQVTDTSLNAGYGILTLNVIDDVVPVINGPTVLSKPTTEALTATNVKSQLSANDVIDGNLTANIQIVSDNFTGHGNIVGSYDIQFSVTDSSGNIAYRTVTINVIDDLPPIFYVKDGYFISVSSVVSLTMTDIVDILIATGQLVSDGTGGVELTATYNEYAGNEGTPGIYALSLEGESVSGNEYVFNLAIEVTEETGAPDVVSEDNPWYVDFWIENSTTIIIVAVSLIVIALGIVALATKMKKQQKKHKKYGK